MNICLLYKKTNITPSIAALVSDIKCHYTHIGRIECTTSCVSLKDLTSWKCFVTINALMKCIYIESFLCLFKFTTSRTGIYLKCIRHLCLPFFFVSSQTLVIKKAWLLLFYVLPGFFFTLWFSLCLL